MFRLARFVSFVFFVLACLVLPQHASAQQSTLSVVSVGPNPVAEGGTVFLAFTRNPAPSSSLGLDIDYDGTADPETDLGSDRPTTTAIGRGNANHSFFVRIADDDTVEGDETFIVTITEDTASAGLTTGPLTFAAVTITDTDTASVSLSSTAPPPAAEGGTITFTVELDNPVAETFTLGWTASNGTATVADDLDDQTGTVEIPADSRTATFTVPIASDADTEGSETFTVALTGAPMDLVNIAPSRITVDRSSATGTINDTLPDAEVSIANASVAENAAAGTIGFTVSLDRAVDSDVTLAVAYAAVTATLADDLGTRPTTVKIDQGTTEATLTVPVTNDDTVEGNETFTVTISEGTTPLPDDVTIGTNQATGTITDADAANVSLSSTAPPAASEGGTITFTVELDNPVAEAFSLGWAATDGTATVNDDLDDQSSTVEIAANARTATFTIRITNDDGTEDSETFTVALTGAPTGLATIAPSRVTVDRSSATGTITGDNDDPKTVPEKVEIVLTAKNASEADTSLSFQPELTAPLTQDLVLAWEVTGGTASADDFKDYAGSGTVTIEAGLGDASIIFVPLDDDATEGDEYLRLTVSAVPGTSLPDGVTFRRDTVTATIADTDEATVNLRVVADVSETDERLTFRPELTRRLTQDFTVSWEVTGGTASADDFSEYASSGTATIPEGRRGTPIRFFPLDDDAVEGDETLEVTISADPNTLLRGVSFGTRMATATIADDEPPVVNATVGIANASVAENVAGGNAEFTVSLSTAVTSDVVLNIAYGGGTTNPATPADDLGSGRPTTVTIDRGRVSATLTVPVTDDGIVEGDETFTVTISEGATPLPEGVTIGTNDTATGTITEDDAAEVTLGPPTLTAAEDATFTYTVSLGAPADEAVTVRWTASAEAGDTATVADDLQAPRTDTVTFAANDNTAQTFTISPVDDPDDEDNETFTVTLEADTQGGNPLPAGVTIGTANSSAATITDDDTPAVNATVGIANASAAENGGNAEFTVSLTTAVDSDVVLAVAYAAGTATPATDLGTRPDTVTIEDGTTSATLRVPIANDNIVEGNETFTVTISEGATPLPDGVTIGTDDTATGTITDDDAAEVTLGTNTPTAAENGGNAEFTVSLTTAVDSDVTLAVAYAAGTATPATDLGARPDTVTIDRNQTSATLLVPIANDNIVEGNEDFTVTISEGATPLPEGVTIGTDDTATGTITDDDTAEVTLGTTTPTAAENGTFTYTVSLSAPADEAVTVRWTASAEAGDTATVADDLQATTGTVTFDAGSNTDQTFTIAVDDDENDENDETFTVTLAVDTRGGNPLPTGVTIGTGNSATATITDNDGTPAGNPTVRIANASVAENSGNAGFTVSLTTAVGSDVVLGVTYAAGQSNPATLATDLGALPTTVTIDQGRTSATLLVPIANDDIVEGNETFTVTLGENNAAPLPDGVAIGDGTATGTIVEDDTAQVTLHPATATAAEDGAFTFIVGLSAAADEAVTVRWTASAASPASPASPESAESAESATVADDLQATTGTVTFDAGTTATQTFTIRPVDDTDDEADETFTVTLAADTPGGNPLPVGVTIGTGNRATATIADNDDAPPPPENALVRIANTTAAEDAGTIGFVVSLSRAVDSRVLLDVAVTAGTATLADDLGTPPPTSVAIDRGNLTATVTVPIADDGIVEGSETFTVTLGENDTTPLPAGVAIRDGTATGTITDDDRAEVTLSSATATAAENGTFTYTVSLSAAADEAVTVRWTASSESGASAESATVADDLQATTGTVTFNAGTNTNQTFTIRPVDDTDDEDDETFTVTLAADTRGGNPLPTGVTIGADDSSTATITDDDEPPENARAGIADATAVEDAGAIGFAVGLSRAVGSDVTLAVAYTAGSADPGTDLGTPLPPTVTIPEGATTATLAVPVVDDDAAEGDETFTVTLGEDPANPLPDDVDIGDGVATGTITDNEEPLVLTAAIRIADAAPAAEDGIARFTITLEPGALSRDALLAVAYAPGTATGGTQPAMPDEDLGRDRPATVTIPAGSRTVVLEVPINDDAAVEDDESFTVTLSAAAEQPNDPDTGRPPGFVLSFPRAEATGTITDNDEAPPPAPGPSVLTAPRLIAAGTALRRHASHIDDLTGAVARSRLDGRGTRRLSAAPDLGAGAVAAGGKLGGSSRGAWIDGAWAGFGGAASGRQVDVYGGVDYLAPDGGWLVGALIGYEAASLEIGETAYRADYTQLGIYGGARLAGRLLFDAAATHGAATPDIALGDVSASYNARRLTLRSALTGDFGLEHGLRTGSVTVRPRLGLLYSREQLRAFTDSAGGEAERTTLELGRFSAGPRLTWAFDGGQVAGGARLQWDFLQLDDGVDRRISGAADIGIKLDLTPNATLGVQGQVDGIGVSDEFGSLGGGIDLDVRF